jgi:hypothetical protein
VSIDAKQLLVESLATPAGDGILVNHDALERWGAAARSGSHARVEYGCLSRRGEAYARAAVARYWAKCATLPAP